MNNEKNLRYESMQLHRISKRCNKEENSRNSCIELSLTKLEIVIACTNNQYAPISVNKNREGKKKIHRFPPNNFLKIKMITEIKYIMVIVERKTQKLDAKYI